LGIKDGGRPASYTAIHRSLLAGFCTMIGTQDERGVYAGTRGLRFSIFPGSPLKRRQPRWIMAANIVETSRVFARTVAQIEPSWIEPAARHLVKREYFAADWSEEREEVVAQERVSLLGLTLSAGRTINYGPIAPEEARHIFAREALVFRRMARRPEWLLRNDARIDDAARSEDRLRTRGLITTSEDLTAQYERLLPRQISGADALEAWTRRAPGAELAALEFTDRTVYAQRPDPDILRDLPLVAIVQGLEVPVHYKFDPDSEDDGATLIAPLLLLPVLTRADLEQAIPGHRLPRIEALMRSLPKTIRKELIPIAESARAFLHARQLQPALRLSDWMAANRGINTREIVVADNGVPAYLIPTLVLADGDIEVGRGSDVVALRRQLSTAAHRSLIEKSIELFDQQWSSFTQAPLARSMDLPLSGGHLRLFPGLTMRESSIGVQLYWTVEEAERTHRIALVHLARLQLRSAERDQAKRIAHDSKLLLAASPYCRADDLTDALQQQSMSQALELGERLPYAADEFEAAVQRARPRLDACFTQCCEQIRALLGDANSLRRLFQDPAVLKRSDLRDESESHLAQLLAPARWRDLTTGQFRQLPRYLKAASVRWRRLTARSAESGQVLAEMQRWRVEVARLQDEFERQKRWTPELDRFGWLVEEYRASLSAQELKTAEAVSPARLQQRVASLQAWLDR
jgi:ATP-dependent helicase HrpA